MAQHSIEAPPTNRLGSLLTITLQERYPLPDLLRQPIKPLSRLVQHRCRRIQQRHLIASLRSGND